MCWLRGWRTLGRIVVRKKFLNCRVYAGSVEHVKQEIPKRCRKAGESTGEISIDQLVAVASGQRFVVALTYLAVPGLMTMGMARSCVGAIFTPRGFRMEE